jgi:hypothetical protein
MRRHCNLTNVHEKVRDHACPNCPGVAFGEKGNLTLTAHINEVHSKIPRRRRRAKEQEYAVCVHIFIYMFIYIYKGVVE